MLTHTCENWQSDGRADVLPIHLSAWLVSVVVDRGPKQETTVPAGRGCGRRSEIVIIMWHNQKGSRGQDSGYGSLTPTYHGGRSVTLTLPIHGLERASVASLSFSAAEWGHQSDLRGYLVKADPLI